MTPLGKQETLDKEDDYIEGTVCILLTMAESMLEPMIVLQKSKIGFVKQPLFLGKEVMKNP